MLKKQSIVVAQTEQELLNIPDIGQKNS